MTVESRAGRKSPSSRRRETLFNLAGLAILGYLVVRIGPDQLVSQIVRFKWWFAAPLLLQTGWYGFQAAAWFVVQNSLSSRVSYWFLLRLKIIADALNAVLPMANLGGDAARAYLIRSQRRIPMREGLAAVLVDKTFEFLGGTITLIAGLTAALVLPRVPDALTLPALACLAVLMIGVISFILLQLNGLYDPLRRTVGRIRTVGRFIEQREEGFRTLDLNLRRFYSGRPSRILTATVLHLVPRVFGIVEILVIARVLGASLGFFEALYIGTIVTITNTVFFLFPGALGVSEAIHLAAAQSLGLTAAVGLTIGIVRRIRRLFFAGLGMVLYRLERSKRSRMLEGEDE